MKVVDAPNDHEAISAALGRHVAAWESSLLASSDHYETQAAAQIKLVDERSELQIQ